MYRPVVYAGVCARAPLCSKLPSVDLRERVDGEQSFTLIVYLSNNILNRERKATN